MRVIISATYKKLDKCIILVNLFELISPNIYDRHDKKLSYLETFFSNIPVQNFYVVIPFLSC